MRRKRWISGILAGVMVMSSVFTGTGLPALAEGTEQQVSNVTVVTDDLAGTENNVDTEKEITDAKIVFDSEGDVLKEGESVTASLVATQKNGQSVELSDVVYSVKGGTAIEVEGNQIKGLVKEQTAILEASTSAGLDQLAVDFDSSRLRGDLVFSDSFDTSENPLLEGLTIEEGRVKAVKESRVINTSHIDEFKGLNGYVVSGRFAIEENAANIAFAASDDSNFYFWQFHSDTNVLKRHTNINGVAAQYGTETALTNLKGPGEENSFAIAFVGNKIFTYLNGVRVDVCDASPDLAAAGSVGVRNGLQESFYLNEISVGENFGLKVDREVTVEKPDLQEIVQVEGISDRTVDVGTSYEDLALPETVAVKLESQDTLELPVAWNGVYDSQTEGTYELYGIVDVQDLCLNTQGLKAGIRINVSSAAEIDTAEAPASVQVNYGTTDAQAIEALAKSILVHYTNGRIGYVPVIWIAPETYDGTAAGDYIFTGALDTQEILEDEGAQALQATVTVLPQDQTAGIQTTELNQAVQLADEIDTAGFTKETADALSSALEGAKSALETQESQESVNTALDALKAAVNGLTKEVCEHGNVKEVTVKEPSCTEEGSIYFVCELCNKTIKTKTIDMTEHELGQWTIVKDPTMDEEGLIERKCKNCTYTEQEPVAKLIAREVTFLDADGIRIGDVVRVPDGTAAQAPAAPERKGYQFAGWSESIEKVTKDMTVTAQYTPIAYKIIYEGLEGAQNPNPAEYTIEDTVELKDPTREAYTFEGWYQGETRITQISKGSTEDQTITAKWRANVQKDIKNTTVSGLSAKTDTGAAITQKPVIKDGEVTLVEGKDYTLAFTDNNKPGTAKITITGIGDYTGTTEAAFVIKAKKGKVYTVGKYKYKVTKVHSKYGTVTLTKPVKTTIKHVKIPDAVQIGSYTYKVTVIGSKAFQNNQKLKLVTVGKNVKTIGAFAFRNSNLLRKITMTGTALTSVGRQSLSGIRAKALIKVPSSRKKLYSRLFSGKGQTIRIS